jgi:hypothetical protein
MASAIFGGVDGKVDLFGGGFGNFEDGFPGAGVEDGLGIAPAGDQFAANQEACFRGQRFGRAFRHETQNKPLWAWLQKE